MTQVALTDESFSIMNETIKSQNEEEFKDEEVDMRFKGNSLSIQQRMSKDRPSAHSQEVQLRQVDYEETEIVIEEEEASFIKNGENKYKFTFSESECPEESYNINAVVRKEPLQAENSPGRGGLDSERSLAQRCSVFESGNKAGDQTLGDDFINSNESKIYERSEALRDFRNSSEANSMQIEMSKQAETDCFNQSLEERINVTENQRKENHETTGESEQSVIKI